MGRPVCEDDIGLKVLYEPPKQGTEPQAEIIDIIAIHGIGAHPDDSWCKNVVADHTGPTDVNWLMDPDMLPSVAPNVRIMRYGYESEWFGDNAIRQKASTVARRFLIAVARKRKAFPFRPLIFIAHCFGGLVILKVLLDARSDTAKWPGIVDATAGLMFFGTPFRGAGGMKLSEMIEAAQREYNEDQIQTDVLQILEPGNEFLQDLVDRFGEIWSQANRAQVACFYELKPSNVGAIVGGQMRTRYVVSESSGCLDTSEATEKYSLSRTHFNMNKFGKPTEEDFLTVSDVIRSMIEKAPEVVLARSQCRDINEYYEVPRKLVYHFIDREGVFHQIQNHFQKTNRASPSILILHALGGQGKTQTTLEYCRRSKDAYRGIFWINASSKETTTEAFERIAAILNRPSPVTLENAEQKIQFVLNNLERWERRWLLVFDNYDLVEEFTDVKDFFPTSQTGHIIMTSRSRSLQRLGNLLELPAMTNDEGLKLLFRNPNTIQHHITGSQIIERLGGLALAIDQAAAYIEHKRMPLADFLRGYEEERNRILAYTPTVGWEYSTLQIHGQTEKNKALSSFTTWEMSFQLLSPEDPQKQEHAAHFLTICAFLDHLNIEEDLFRCVWETEESPPEWLKIFADSGKEASIDEGQPKQSLFQRILKSHKKQHLEWKSEFFWDLTARCFELSLLQVRKVPGQSNQEHEVFSLHPLIRDWLQLREGKERRRSYCQEAINVVSVSIRSFHGRGTTAGQKNALIMHMDACLVNDKQSSESENTSRWYIEDQIAIEFSIMYTEQGHWTKAERLGFNALKTRKRVLGPDHLNTMIIINNLVKTYRLQGQSRKAMELTVQLLEANEVLFGPEHPNTLATTVNLAQSYREHGQFIKAEELSIKSIEACKRVLGSEHPTTLHCISTLAGIYMQQSQLDKAEELSKEAIEASERVFGVEHLATLNIMSILAEINKRQGQLSKAEQLSIQAIETIKRVLGSEHPTTLHCISTLASVYKQQGQLDKAEELSIEAMETSRRVYGREHPVSLSCMSMLAGTYSQQGQLRKAEELFVRLLELSKRVLGLEHPNTLADMLGLAYVWKSQHRNEDALLLLTQAVALLEKHHGASHYRTIEIMSVLNEWKSEDVSEMDGLAAV